MKIASEMDPEMLVKRVSSCSSCREILIKFAKPNSLQSTSAVPILSVDAFGEPFESEILPLPQFIKASV